MPEGMIDFLRGGTMVALLGSSLFFLRCWLATRDVFYILFAAAFILMAVSQTGSLLTGDNGDFSPAAYWVRLVGFILITIAIVAKNLPANPNQ